MPRLPQGMELFLEYNESNKVKYYELLITTILLHEFLKKKPLECRAQPFLKEPVPLFRAYECVIVLRLAPLNWTALQPLIQAVREQAKTFYNYTYTKDEYVRIFEGRLGLLNF